MVERRKQGQEKQREEKRNTKPMTRRNEGMESPIETEIRWMIKTDNLALVNIVNIRANRQSQANTLQRSRNKLQ